MISEPIILAVINVLVGGIALKVVEHLITKNKSKLDEIAQFRQELSTENRYLRSEWRKTEEELNQCREELSETRGRLATYLRKQRTQNRNDVQPDGTDTK